MAVFDHTSPILDASVERTGQDAVRLSWKTHLKNLRVSIYHGDSADTIERNKPISQIEGQTAVEIAGLNPDIPHYFEIMSENSAGIIIGERRLPLEGTVNFRDLGGYETTDGRRVRWGKVFRSDHLSRLTDRDIAFLQRMKIQCVCDFRTPAEAQKRPDRFPGDGPAAYLHLPIDNLKFNPTTLFEKLKSGDTSWLTPEFLIDGYILNIDKFAAIWGEVFRRLADPDQLALVFHCTGGKDRAGTCAALVLLALGVPEETVIRDHGLSNIFIADVLDKIYAQFESSGVDRSRISPYFTAPQYCIEALLHHLHEKYGSPADYLKSKAGVTAEMLDRIKGQLLE
ncbi:MAG: tyrosine-protein phosphatase [Desulfobacterales bacterium]|jgi:protein-tyrosine phosphatase|nr:tyrosine-protein phosphatase [Desulfobacterales bacterium]